MMNSILASAPLPYGSSLRALSRRERMERWADRLASELRELASCEVDDPFAGDDPDELSDDTALAIARMDPLLRREGLAGDCLIDAVAFFGLTLNEAEYLLRPGSYHGPMTGPAVAQRLRALAGRRFDA